MNRQSSFTKRFQKRPLLPGQKKPNRRRKRRACQFEQLEARRVLAAAVWNNVGFPVNVDGDQGGVVSPLDALLVINEINSRRYSDSTTGELPKQIGGDAQGFFFDVSCDNYVTPIDALQVINHINRGGDAGTNGTGVFPDVACSPQLVEGANFSEEFTHELTLPNDSSAVRIHFQAPEFDTSSENSIRDAFEIELTDSSGNPVSFPFLPNRDAVYNWSELLEPQFGVGAETTTSVTPGEVSTLTVNLAGMEAGSIIQVSARLVNNDADDGTSVILRGFEVIDSFGAAPTGAVAANRRLPTRMPLIMDDLDDVSGSFVPTYGHTTLNGDNNELFTSLEVTNKGTQTVTGRLIVAVENISELDAATMHPDGLLPNGQPYWDLTQEMDGKPLAPGETIRSREIAFRNDSGSRFSYKLTTYGSLNVAPTGFTSIPLTKIEAGDQYVYLAEAVEPDGQPLTYAKVVGPQGMQVDAGTGQITWATTTEDIGAHSIILRATDPHGLYVQQTYTLEVVASLQNRPPIFVSDPVTDAIASSGFEITTVGVGNAPTGVAIVGGFRGPRLVTANAADQTIGVYAGENNDRFDDAMAYPTGHPRRNAQWVDAGITVDFGFPEARNQTDGFDISTYDQGDFNGDGFLDFVVAYHFDLNGDSSIGTFGAAVVLNDGNGAFGEPNVLYEQEIYRYQTYVRSILAEDVNADGHNDILFAESHNGGTLFVSLGNGDGTFQPIIETTYEDAVIGDFKVADIDGDSIPDLFGRTINSGNARSLFWSKGNGDGTFEAPHEFRQTRNSGLRDTAAPYDLSDLDGDGDLDFVISGNYPYIQVFHNDGSGEFSLVNDFTPPNAFAFYGPDWLVVGDFTGDGHQDVLLHHVWESGLDLMVGDASGIDFTYEDRTEVRLRPDNWAMGFEPMDVDGDGDLDVVFGTEQSRQGVSVGLNDGTGTFLLREYATPEVSTGVKLSYTDVTVRGALFGDYNSDGVVDVSYFTTDSDFNGQTDQHSVGILFGTRPGEFGRTRTEPWVTASWTDVAHPGDFNGDGIWDILDTASDVTALGNGDGTFGELLPASGVRRPSAAAAIADYDNDGLDDVVSALSGGLYVGLSNGDGTFRVNQNISGGGFYGYNTIEAVDLNLDGFMDFVTKAEVDEYFEAYLNDPLNPGTFNMSFSYALAEGSQGINVSNWEESWDLGDFTGDGIPDLLTAEREDLSGTPIEIVVFAGDGQGGFNRYSELAGYEEDKQAGIYGSRVEPGDFATGDIDNDGDLDLIAHSYLGARVFVNDGAGNFTATRTMLDAVRTNQRGRDSWLVDFDEDGNLDFVVAVAADINGSFLFWRGDGNGNFKVVEGVNMHAEPWTIREPFLDWDNDGHLDLVYATAGTNSDEIAFYMGRRDDLVDIIAVDLNGDGNEEVLAVQEQMERLQVFAGDNLGGLTRLPDLQAGRSPQAVTTADLDGDGQLELLVANRVSRDVTVYRGNLTDGYTETQFAVGDTSDLAASPVDILSADVDDDGDPEVFVLDQGQNALWMFAGDGVSELGTPTAIAIGDRPGRFVLDDATGDGVLDAVITLPDTNRLMILGSVGTDGAAAPVYVSLSDAPSDVAVLDLNADGSPDIAATLEGSDVASIHYGLGNVQFARAQEVQVGDAPNRIEVTDADEDGRMDLVTSNVGDDTVSVIYNRFDPNEVYRYDSDAIDPDDDLLTYSIMDGPGGLIINGTTGALLWAASPDQVGVHDVTIAADDGRGGVATQSFKIAVVPARENAPPVIATTAIEQIGANEAFSYSVQALDQDNHPLRYSLQEGPEGASIDPITGELSWDGRTQAEAYGVANSGGYIAVPYADSLKPESITIEGWVQLSRLTRFNEFIRDQGILVTTHEVNQSFRVDVTLDGESLRFFTQVKPVAERWYHLAFTFDATTGTASLYIDGQLAGTATASEPKPLNTTPGITHVGRTGGTDASFEQYRVWNYARSQSELIEGQTRQFSNDDRLILDFRFEDGPNNRSVYDHSMYGNTGYRVSNFGETQTRAGLTEVGSQTFTVRVEDGRGGSDVQTFTLDVVPELRGSLRGHLFDDLNGDGDQNDGSEQGVPEEPNLEGWHLWIDSNGNGFPDPQERQATTDADGNYSFEGLLPGSYPVSVSPIAGYETPAEFTATVEAEIVRELNAGATTDHDLAIEQLSLSQIRGQFKTEGGDAIAYWKAYADLDDDGQRGDDEPVAMSDRNGNYAITGLDAGTYAIRPDLPVGWDDSAGRDGLAVTLAADEIAADNDFIFEPTNTTVTGGIHFLTMPETEVAARQRFSYASVAMGISEVAITYDLSLAPAGMVIDPRTGLVAWRPTIDQVGKHLVLLRATDASGSISLHDFYVDVAAPNTPPAVLTELLPQRVYVNTPASYHVIAQDAELTDWSFALGPNAFGAAIDSQSGHIQWTPTAGDVGDQSLVIEVTDDAGALTQATWNFEVIDTSPSSLPLVVNYPRETAAVTRNYFGRISAHDAMGRPVTWSLASGPSGLTVVSNGFIDWTPSADQLGAQTVELLGTTADGQTETVSLDIQVLGRSMNSIPVIESEPVSSLSLGQSLAYDLHVTDADQDIHAFTLLAGPVGMSVHSSRGYLRWTPAADQLGEHDVLVQASDPSGNTAEQSFKLQVSRFGGPPRIVSIPPTEAGVGSAFLYSVEANDREGDPLMYSLLTAPSGMSIVETTGEIVWTPVAGQVGQQDVVVQVSDGRGGATTQAFAINVSAGAVNLPPEITSAAPRFGAVGTAYSYTLTATDPENTDPENTDIAYSLGRGPTGMTVDSATGQVSWTPAAGDEGKYVVTFIATDAGGAATIESFELDVLAQNTVPSIDSDPPLQSVAGAEFAYDVLASDADLDALSFELTESPTGAEIDAFGRLRWKTALGDVSNYDFSLKVTDPKGGESTQSFTLALVADTEAPKVSLIEVPNDANRNILPWMGPFIVYAKAIDNVEVASLTLTANGQGIPLSAAGTAIFAFEDWFFNNINVTATAIDTSGNVTEKTITFNYDVPEGWSTNPGPEVPTAIITSPIDNSTTFGMVSINGTADHQDFGAYTLSYRRVDDTSFTEIVRSTTRVVDGELGVWDTSLLANDEYVIRLQVATTEGTANVVEHKVGLAGELKLGDFQLSFTDLEFPLAGIPIEVTRSYDSLQADQQGDFGFGWRLEYRNTNLRVGLPKSGLEDIGIYSALRPGVKVFLNVPGQGRRGFTFNPDIRVLPGWGGNNLVLARPRFTPDPGVTATLGTGTSSYLQVNEQGELFAPGGIPYNPASPDFGGAYTLSTLDGTTYRIDGATGNLQAAINRDGSQVRFTEDGISNDDGLRLEILRDAQDRIVQIIDNSGASLHYAYEKGDLVAVTDREGNTTSLRYSMEHPHYLEQILDPLGRNGVRAEYNADGRLTSILNGSDGAAEFSYDPNNSVVVTTNALGNSTAIEYDEMGRVVAVTDPRGATTQSTYDENGFLTSRTDPLNRTTHYTIDSFGRTIAETSPSGEVTRRLYSTTGDVLQETDPAGNTQSAEYNEQGRPVSARDLAGNVATASYSASGQLVSAIGLDGTRIETGFQGDQLESLSIGGEQVVFTYDDNGLPEMAFTDLEIAGAPTRVEQRVDRDLNGRIVKVTDATGAVTRFDHDAAGNIISSIAPTGRETRFEYNASNQLTRTIFPGGGIEERSFDADGNLVSVVDPDGIETRYEHDASGNRTAIIFADDTPDNPDDNPRRTMEYDLAGQLVSSINELGGNESFIYDVNGLLTQHSNALGAKSIFEYDSRGNLTTEIDALGRATRHAYDAKSNRISTIHPDGSEESLEYDALGRLIRQTNGASESTRFAYDSFGRLTTVFDALGQQTSYAYNELGHLDTLTDAGGKEFHFTFDVAGRPTSRTLPTGETATATYVAGELVATNDFAGAETQYSYDDAGEIQQIRYPDGQVIEFSYSPAQRLVAIQDDDEVVEYTYDARGRIQARTDPNGTSLNYEYDAASNVISIGGAISSAFDYDVAGQLRTVTDSDGETTRYEYDAVGHQVEVVFPNGVVQTRSYDERGNLVQQTDEVSGTELLSLLYSYDAAQRKTSITDGTGRKTEYSYDQLGRLLQEAVYEGDTLSRVTTYSYDSASNRTQRIDSVLGATNYEYDQNDRLLVERLQGGTEIRYEYDANGQRTRKETAEETTTFVWSAAGRLLESATESLGGTLSTVRYTYDAEGERIQQNADGRITNYVVDANRDVSQVVAIVENGESVELVRPSQSGQLIAQKSSSTALYLHANDQGSVRVASDSSGSVTDRVAYDAFGNVANRVGSSTLAVLYAGEIRSTGNQLDFLRTRYYDTSTGSFLSADTFPGHQSNPISLNRYVYAYQDPINNTDPTGQSPTAEQIVTVGLVAGFTAIGAYVGYQFGAEHDSPVLGTILGAFAGFGIGVLAVSGGVSLLTLEGVALETLQVSTKVAALSGGILTADAAGVLIVGGGLGTLMSAAGVGGLLAFEILYQTLAGTGTAVGRTSR